MSGKNQPYEPESADCIRELLPPIELVLTTLPAEPDTNWKTLPASLNTTELTTWLLSVKEILPAEPESNSVVEPGSNDSLYLLLSTEIVQKSEDVIPPKANDRVFIT
jgi:hypothetical protein